MVAMPSDMREAAYLQLNATYRRLRAAHIKLQHEWDAKVDLPEAWGAWLRALNQARADFRDAHMDFDAAVKLFSREIGPCPACQKLRGCFHTCK